MRERGFAAVGGPRLLRWNRARPLLIRLSGRFRRNIIEQPRAYIAQETLDFSKRLIFDESTGSFEERYVDLRVFAVQKGRGEAHAFPGGLTRVANANSRITNNSSGGRCKPTWVIR